MQLGKFWVTVRSLRPQRSIDAEGGESIKVAVLVDARVFRGTRVFLKPFLLNIHTKLIILFYGLQHGDCSAPALDQPNVSQIQIQ